MLKIQKLVIRILNCIVCAIFLLYSLAACGRTDKNTTINTETIAPYTATSEATTGAVQEMEAEAENESVEETQKENIEEAFAAYIDLLDEYKDFILNTDGFKPGDYRDAVSLSDITGDNIPELFLNCVRPYDEAPMAGAYYIDTHIYTYVAGETKELLEPATFFNAQAARCYYIYFKTNSSDNLFFMDYFTDVGYTCLTLTEYENGSLKPVMQESAGHCLKEIYEEVYKPAGMEYPEPRCELNGKQTDYNTLQTMNAEIFNDISEIIIFNSYENTIDYLFETDETFGFNGTYASLGTAQMTYDEAMAYLKGNTKTDSSQVAMLTENSISRIKSKYITAGSLDPKRNTDVNGISYGANNITPSGETWETDWTNDESEGWMSFNLNGKYASLSGTVYRPACTAQCVNEWQITPVVKIYGDGTLLYTAPDFSLETTESVDFQVSVEGVDELKIVMLGVWIESESHDYGSRYYRMPKIGVGNLMLN